MSVIIPVYNHAHELERCLVSLAGQTFTDFELIIVDDGSTDSVIKVFEKARYLFPHCIIIAQKNHGAAHARNRGREAAQGEYLLFADADCDFKPCALSVFKNALETHPQAAFAYCAFYFGWKKMKGVPFNAELLQKFNYIHTTSMICASFFPGFDESLKKFQDWDLWLTIVNRGGMGILIEEPLFRLKPRKEGMSRWLPKAAYRLPWEWIGFTPRAIKEYMAGQAIIKQKHNDKR